MNSGERLKIWRTEKNISMSKLAKTIGTSPSMISMYESGKTALSDKYLSKLHNAYGISIDWLLSGNHPGETKEQIPEQYKEIIEVYETLDREHQEELIRIGKHLMPPADQEDPGSESTVSQKAG